MSTIPSPGQAILGHYIMRASVEVRAGIEPAHVGFADRSVTTSPSHLRFLVVIYHKRP